MRSIHHKLVLFQRSRNCFRYVPENDTEEDILAETYQVIWPAIHHASYNWNNRKYSNAEIRNLTEELTRIITSMTDHIRISKSSPENKDSPNDQDPTTVFPYTKRAPPLECRHSTKNQWHMDSKTQHKLTKVIWTTHKDRNERLHWSGPQELLQPHQDVYQCGE